MKIERSPYAPARAIFSTIIAVFTLLLIGAGAAVTSMNAGLAVPDWPTSFGYHMWSMPFSLWRGGIFYEHFHRVIASILGLLVLIMSIWLIICESRTWVRYLGIACLGAVVVQGCLGGLTVLMRLPVAVSVFHGVLGQVFLALSIWLAFSQSRRRACADTPDSKPPVGPAVRRWVVVLLGVVLLQLILAATMRHDFKLMGGVAIPDFPTVAGSWSPWVDADRVEWVNAWRRDAVESHGAVFNVNTPVAYYQVLIHFLHRCVAFAILGLVLVLTFKIRPLDVHGQGIKGAVYALNGLVVLAISLGVLTVWSNRGPLVTSLHVVTGAAILGTCVLLLLRVQFPALSDSDSHT